MAARPTTPTGVDSSAFEPEEGRGNGSQSSRARVTSSGKKPPFLPADDVEARNEHQSDLNLHLEDMMADPDVSQDPYAPRATHAAFVTVNGYYQGGVAYGAVLDERQRDRLTGVILVAPPALISSIEAASGQVSGLGVAGSNTVIDLHSVEGVLAYMLSRTQVVAISGPLPVAFAEVGTGGCWRPSYIAPPPCGLDEIDWAD